jgi:hypothetical protein
MVALMFKLIKQAATRNRPSIRSHPAPSSLAARKLSQAPRNAPKQEDRFLHESTRDVDAAGLPLWLGTDRKIYSGFNNSGKAIIWTESLNGVESTSFTKTRDPYCYLPFGDFDLFYTKNQRAIEGARRVQRAASTRMNLLAPEHPDRKQWQQWIKDAAAAIQELSAGT